MENKRGEGSGAQVWVIFAILLSVIIALWFYPNIFKGIITGAFYWVKSAVAP